MKLKYLNIVLILCMLITIPVYATKQDFLMLLLTEHYGILNYRDLELYTLNRNIRPFEPHNPSGQEYWQCFNSKNISVNFHSWVNDDITGEQNCDMHIIVTLDDQIVHEYGLRRALPVKYCRNKNRLWNNMIKNQPYACLGGIYVGESKKSIKGNKSKVKKWVYDKIKTKEDYDTYFEDPEEGI